ncbi:hypothetical protein B0I37DRAFT_359000 [Chaetomium sp. MPI-CAGE-AT-0009]|nr:hypothetical protein B0I37DRAFT_359000 [Chaetomium sp. MPI-CAGE-AT-0009]
MFAWSPGVTGVRLSWTFYFFLLWVTWSRVPSHHCVSQCLGRSRSTSVEFKGRPHPNSGRPLIFYRIDPSLPQRSETTLFETSWKLCIARDAANMIA